MKKSSDLRQSPSASLRSLDRGALAAVTGGVSDGGWDTHGDRTAQLADGFAWDSHGDTGGVRNP